MNFFEYIKNLLLILLFLQFAPSLVSNIKKQYLSYIEPRTQVAVIPVRGILYNSSSYTKQLQKYFKDPAIKAILLKMECPGSATGTGQSIYNEIVQLKKQYPKPIVVLVENTCASGGYLIACACDHIIAPSMAVVGSIGTALPYLFQAREFIEYHHLRYIPLTAGKYKGSTDPFVDLTPEQKELLQSVADDSYHEFTNIVIKSRKLSTATIDQWAEGKIFTGNQALKIGLIDEVGSITNALNALKEKAMIEGEIEWIREPEPSGIASMLFGKPTDDETTALSSMINQTCSVLESRYAGPRLQA